jgi:hypothetical protein
MQVLTAVLLACALIAFAQPPSIVRTSAQETNPITQAHTFVSAQRTLTSSEIQILRDAIIKAMAGRYLVEDAPTKTAVTDGASPDPMSDGTEEYQLDAGARVRFSRLTFPARGVFQPETRTLNEFTDMPGVKCADRVPFPGRRLRISYSHSNGKWIINVALYGSYQDWGNLGPLGFLFEPGIELTDAGLRRTTRHHLRGLRTRNGVKEDTGWFDVESLLIRENATVITIDGKGPEIVNSWGYPQGSQLVRPPGVTVQNCLY